MAELLNIIKVSAGGNLGWRGKEYRCAIGRGGIKHDKKEGDGVTPAGIFPLRQVFYRADREGKPETDLPAQILSPDDGWCDDTNDPAYNTHIKLPYSGHHEKLYRDDNIYDFIIPIGYNDDPAVSGKGSALFVHLARPDYRPTAGCIALAENDLREILKTITGETVIDVRG